MSNKHNNQSRNIKLWAIAISAVVGLETAAQAVIALTS